MNTYVFKLGPEMAFALTIAALTALLQILVEFDANTVENWEFWAISAGSGIARAVAVAGLAVLGKAAFSR